MSSARVQQEEGVWQEHRPGPVCWGKSQLISRICKLVTLQTIYPLKAWAAIVRQDREAAVHELLQKVGPAASTADLGECLRKCRALLAEAARVDCRLVCYDDSPPGC